MAWLQAPKNALSFAARELVGWRRGAPVLRQESKQYLFGFLDAAAAHRASGRERDLRSRYGLRPLRECSTCLDYRDNLALLDALERAFDGHPLPTVTRAVDVGCKNWSSVFALERFLAKRCGGPAELHGVEVDVHGVYPDLRSRHDYAQAYAAQTGNENLAFHAGDFLELDLGTFDATFCFFPFLTREALLAWGLPLRFFQPERFVERLLAVTRPGGVVVVFNQTAAERDRLRELLGEHAASARSVRIPCELVHYRAATQDRHATVVEVGTHA